MLSVHHGVLIIKKNEIISFAGKWTVLKITKLSEISQPHNDKYHMFFSHLWKLETKHSKTSKPKQ
jgi:hypothetical protein